VPHEDKQLTSPSAPIGIFGGTFDPIHYGHLRTALELLQRLSLSQVRFIPCAEPPHRDEPARAAHLRLRMVEAAVADQPAFVVDDREFIRKGPSYSIDTLRSLRLDVGSTPICLLMGMDAFLGLPEWYQWQGIFEYAHVVVAHRPGWTAPETGLVADLLVERGTEDIDRLHAVASGCVLITAVTQLEVSASDLRASLSAGLDPKFLMPDSVRAIILESGCYVEAS
jgi:nicotinate-nucleotide adenylyltransferase